MLNIVLVLLDVPKLDVYNGNDNKYRYANQDNVARTEGYSRYHVNSYGLIGQEPISTNDPSIFRIGIFGDSFVEALHIQQNDTFTDMSPLVESIKWGLSPQDQADFFPGIYSQDIYPTFNNARLNTI